MEPHNGLAGLLAGHPVALAAAVVADLVVGDPAYRWHPVRLIGHTLTGIEKGLRRIGADGYGGGIALAAVLAALWVPVLSALVLAAGTIARELGWLLHAFLVYSLLAFGDLLRHVRRIERELTRNDLDAARVAVAKLVSRDTHRMDAGACRRAAIESLSENLTDGFTSPIFWYAVAGLPALVLFKVVSTLDSMVGYKTPRYLRFGWCGARLDDMMNYVPARATWLLIAAVAAVLPGWSGLGALAVGFRQHAVLPGPNSGWSEAATAGAIRRRLVGPIWMHDSLVTDLWVGDSNDPPAATADDMRRALILVTTTGVAAAALAVAALSC